MTNAILRGKPDAGNPHVRFDEGEVASAKPRRGSLLYKKTIVLLTFAAALAAEAGVWCYRPYEYEAWMLQQMRAEADRGVLHFGYPGKFLRLSKEPQAFYSETPVEGYEAVASCRL